MRDLLRILRSATQLWRYYLAVGIFTILLALANLLQPLLSGFAIDAIRTHASVKYVVFLAFAIFGLELAANFFSNIGGYFGDQMSERLKRILSRRYFSHLLSLPQMYFDRELSGKIINRLSRSINQITSFMKMLGNNFLQFIFTTIFTLAVVFHYSWQVGVLFLLVYPVFMFLTMQTSKKWVKFQDKKNHHYDMASGRFAEAITQVKVVKSFLSERRELKLFNHHYDIAVDTNQPQSKYWHQRDVLRRFVLNVIFLLVYLYIFIQGVQGNLSPGIVVALILYGMQIRTPIFTISMLVEATQRAISDSRDYFEIMDIKPQIVDKPGAKKLEVKNARVEFEQVAFGYEKNMPVVSDISLELPPDKKSALVGESGEGKTTLTSLLLRLYEPSSGKILIDGQDILAVTQASLRKNIAVVFQDAALFSGTIRENIAYSKPKATAEKIEQAARAANAHDFVKNFEKGYDTEIGERGLKLSGGQKQRIAIARAILKDAPILILDEATSSLDSRSEYLVQQALTHLMKNRTTLIIAHRLSTIQHADQIITLKKGHVDEIGPPEKLAHSGGLYEELLQLQTNVAVSAVSDQKLHSYDIEG
jgi:ATP-binding cassette subfamily B protein